MRSARANGYSCLCWHAVNLRQVRVNFLAPLLHEGKQHLQQHLTASVLGRKVFYMPFHRGIQVTQQSRGAMAAALSYCQQVNAWHAWDCCALH